MGTSADGTRTARFPARVLLAAAALGIVAVGWAILAREPRAAGLALVGTGVLLVAASATRRGAPIDVLLSSTADRLFDGVILGAAAWAYRSEEPATAAGALAALGASFLSAYIRARGVSLGYAVEEGLGTRSVRYALVAVGLATGRIGWTVWVLFALVTLSAAVRAGQVVKEERA